LIFAKKLAGDETNRQKEMRFDDQHVTNGLSESRSPFFLCALQRTTQNITTYGWPRRLGAAKLDSIFP
jgi:hypothetical protein